MNQMNYRKGRFTSSKISALIPYGKVKMSAEELIKWKEENPKSRVTTKAGGFGSTGETYIHEKNLEWKLQRGLSTSVYSQAIMWGYVMEKLCFELLPLGYKILVAEYPKPHPDKEFVDTWAGVPDLKFQDFMISEIKSYQLKGFAEYSDILKMQDVDILRSERPSEYWQIVSNSVLYETTHGEAISFMPYKEDLINVRKEIEESNFLERWGFEPWQCRFLVEKPLNQLAYIEKGGHYKNIERFAFEVPQEDKDLLTERVRQAKARLTKFKK